MIDREFFDELQDEYEDIIEEGKEARRRGEGLDSNPYDEFFSDYWVKGWREKDAESS